MVAYVKVRPDRSAGTGCAAFASRRATGTAYSSGCPTDHFTATTRSASASPRHGTRVDCRPACSSWVAEVWGSSAWHCGWPSCSFVSVPVRRACPNRAATASNAGTPNAACTRTFTGSSRDRVSRTATRRRTTSRPIWATRSRNGWPRTACGRRRPVSEGIHVATVRALVHQASIRPAMAARAVFVVGDAERMVSQEGADQAANAFLKLLEEPAGGTTLILTTSEPGALLPTIRSRVVTMRVPPLGPADMDAFLGDAAVARRLAKLSRGDAVARAAGAPGELLGERVHGGIVRDRAPSTGSRVASSHAGRVRRAGQGCGEAGGRRRAWRVHRHARCVNHPAA